MSPDQAGYRRDESSEHCRPFYVRRVFHAADGLYGQGGDLQNSGMRHITRWYGSFTVRRGEPDREAIRNCIDVLKREESSDSFLKVRGARPGISVR